MIKQLDPADFERELSTMMGTMGFTPKVTKGGIMYSRPSKGGSFTLTLGILSFPKNMVGEQAMFTHLGMPEFGLEVHPMTDEGLHGLYESAAQVAQNLAWDFPA